METIEKILSINEFGPFCFSEFYTGKTPIPNGYSIASPRFTYVIDGCLQLNLGTGDRILFQECNRGETVVMHPYTVTAGIWEKAHETCGLVFRSEFLRIIHAVFNEPGKSLSEPTDYYHLKDSLRLCTMHAIHSLCSLHEDPDSQKAGPDLLRSVFTLLLSDIRQSTASEYGKAYALWNKILDYVNLSFQPTRKELSEHFMITETYVSRLFSTFGKTTFKEYLQSCRLKKAEKLLHETNMTIAEIAYACGYQSSSYFIRAFRSANKISPGFYRRIKT